MSAGLTRRANAESRDRIFNNKSKSIDFESKVHPALSSTKNEAEAIEFSIRSFVSRLDRFTPKKSVYFFVSIWFLVIFAKAKQFLSVQISLNPYKTPIAHC